MVVDDNVDDGEMIAELLNAHGILACHVSSGLKAVRVAATFLPDVIFLAISTPSMDGFEALAELKQIPLVRDARFVELTALEHAQLASQLRQVGFAVGVGKPASIETLLSCVDQRGTPAAGA